MSNPAAATAAAQRGRLNREANPYQSQWGVRLRSGRRDRGFAGREVHLDPAEARSQLGVHRHREPELLEQRLAAVLVGDRDRHGLDVRRCS